MDFYSAMRNNDFMNFLRKCMHLENIILSEITESEKNRHNMQSLIIGYKPQKALSIPETTHTPHEVQEKNKDKKEKKRKNIMLNLYTARKL